MRKIPTLFQRDPDDRRHVLAEVTPGCEWVLAGEGVATRKWDGTCCMLDGLGRWWARREVKPGKEAPADFAAIDGDPVTGKIVGWVPIASSSFATFHAEAVAETPWTIAGTYELVGPKINGNPEDLARHELIPHGDDKISVTGNPPPSAFIDLCRTMGWEGVVWHHPDGRMAKLKVRDFPEARS